MMKSLLTVVLMLYCSLLPAAQDNTAEKENISSVAEKDSSERIEGGEKENASNPLAALNNTDFRYRYYDLGDGTERHRYNVEGSYMLFKCLKLTYELNYFNTDTVGSFHSDWESLRLKLMLLGYPQKLTSCIGYKLGLGLEWIKALGDVQDGTSSGSDQLAPFAGASWVLSPQDTVITFVQYFQSYSKETLASDVSQTGPRVIWIHSFPCYAMWIKLDDKFVIDHKNSNATSNTIEAQLGKDLNKGVAVYVDFLYQTSGFHQYNWGSGVGLRFNY